MNSHSLQRRNYVRDNKRRGSSAPRMIAAPVADGVKARRIDARRRINTDCASVE